jgi:hypothetical protein
MGARLAKPRLSGPWALLHAQLHRFDGPLGESDDGKAHWATAHRYLGLAAAATGHRPVEGAFAGLGALATAARAGAGPGEYASLLRRTDTRMAASARRLAILHTTTRDAGVPTYAAVVDVLAVSAVSAAVCCTAATGSPPASARNAAR